MERIATRVQQIFVEQLGVPVDAVEPGARLAHDLRADSLDRIELMMACEEEFGITIDDPEAERCQTVADVVALITAKVGARTRAASA